jgi:two-component system, NtrC family, nitrogen regulation response regulator NtrX
MAHDILVVDDERDIRELVAGILEDEGHDVRVAANSSEALDAISERRPSLVILDIWLQDSPLDGIEILDRIRASDGELPVVMISGHGTVETAVAAIQKGAYDFIEKPFQADRLLHTISKALEVTSLKRENRELRERSSDHIDMIGSTQAINQVRQIAAKVAPTNSRVLIVGASGTGKEVVARLLHEKSPRASSRFIAINAATMSPLGVERELFGEEDNVGRIVKAGLFEQAHRGTLFLDEVGEMPIETQSRILRLLVDQRFRRLNGSRDVQVDVRVISSSSRDLEAEIEAGRFRRDLYHRLNVVPIRVPTLAERREDIPQLVEHFVERLARSSGLPARQIADDAMAALQANDWPGNVRQLRNNVERLLILAGGEANEPISLDHLPKDAMGDGGAPELSAERMISMPLRDARECFEREYLYAQVTRFNGNISRTAKFIGMERSALHRKLKTLGVHMQSDRADEEGDEETTA